jgi:hypothetical protein
MSIKVIAMEGPWMRFSQPAMRHEVVQYLFGSGFVPSATELYPRTEDAHTSAGLVIELAHTHWRLAQTAFAAQENLYQRMRPEIRQLIAALPRQPANYVWRSRPTVPGR